MHLYFVDQKRLEADLRGFAGGQFQMKTALGVLRGEIDKCFALGDKRLEIHLSWLCERLWLHSFSEGLLEVQEKWSLLKLPSSSLCLDVQYSYFYFQTDENRLKMKGQLGEICHFFAKDDHTNLVRREDNEFTPYFKLNESKLKVAVFTILSQKRQ